MDSKPATVPGKFVDVSKDLVTIECGRCGKDTSATIPREEYHVVTVGTNIGVFTNIPIADASVAGVPGGTRKKFYDIHQATEYLKDAITADLLKLKGKTEKWN